MKRLFFIFLLLSALQCFASFTNVVGINIETNGWIADVTIGGDAAGSIGTNGNFFSGLGTNNSLTSTTALTLTMSSMGFDDSGSGIQVSRTVYGTKIIRLPFPLQQTNDIQFQDSGGTNVVFRIALSDFICSRDSNIVATALGGWISGTNGNSTNVVAISGFSVTNSSTVTYPKTIANWTMPCWNRWTNAAPVLQVFAAQYFAQAGRPIRMIQFVAQDAHSHAVTNKVTAMVATLGPLTGVAVCEWLVTLDISTFTAGDLVRCDFTAFPWVGDSTSECDTFDAVNTMPTPKYAAVTNLYDPNYTYATSNGTWAVVAQGGNDSTGVASTNVLNTASPPAAFLTINGACLGIKATNNLVFSHNDLGAGIVYLQPHTNWDLPGGSGSYGTIPKSWFTVTRFPTCSVAQVIINTNTGNLKICQRDRVASVTVSNFWRNDGIGCWLRSEALWFDTCTLNIDPGDATSTKKTIREVTNAIATSCTVNEMRDGSSIGFGPSGSNPGSWSLVRDCLLNSTGAQTPWMLIGNARTKPNATANGNAFIQTEITGGAASALPDTCVVAFNDFRNLIWSPAATVQKYFLTKPAAGFAFIQNVIEKITNDTQYALQIASDGISTGSTNILYWNNTIVGQRVNNFYNDSGSVALPLVLCTKKNNISDDDNIKTDNFPTANGARIGNWPCVWGVGWSGNVDSQINGVGVPGDFVNGSVGAANDCFGFFGLNGRQQGPTNGPVWQQYIDRRGFDGVSNYGGGGNYRLRNSSPIKTWTCQQLLPFDLQGSPRSTNDPPGAYIFYGGGPSLMTGNGRLTGGASLK